MSRAARRSLIALCVLLALLGVSQPDRSREFSQTTYGALPDGYGALVALLTTLGLPVARWLDPPQALPAGATVWWIEPQGLCRPAPPVPGAHEVVWAGDTWLAAGGTAVVFLLGGGRDACAEIAGVPLPARRDQRRAEPPAAAADGESIRDAPAPVSLLDGPLLAAPRRMPMPGLAVFDSAGGGEVLVRLGEDPFALAFAVGRGRLVLVADARPLRNRWLDQGDAAPLAIDLVRAYGTPLIDEYHHGMHRPGDALRYLATSSALPALLGIVLLGGLVVWHGHLWPARRAADDALPAPTLDAFVDSLARLYARTGDFNRVAEHYRLLTAARLRRVCGLPAEMPLPALFDQLRVSGRAAAARLAPLAVPVAVTNAEALRAQVRALDALVEEATR